MSQPKDVKCTFHSSCQKGCSHLKDATLLGLILYLARQRFLSTTRWGKTSSRNCLHQLACALHLMYHRVRQLLYKSASCYWTTFLHCFAFRMAIFINLLGFRNLTFAEWMLASHVTMCDLQGLELKMYCFYLLSKSKTLYGMKCLKEKSLQLLSISLFSFYLLKNNKVLADGCCQIKKQNKTLKIK